MTAEAHAAAHAMLLRYNTATLATSSSAGPWAATVFYACDESLKLYFVSDPKTRHCRDLAQNPELAVSIYTDCPDWSQIAGLQLRGRAHMLTGDAREAGLRCYLDGLPGVAALIEHPRNPEESLIAERLSRAVVYQVTPSWLRLVDNSRGFGFKQELVL